MSTTCASAPPARLKTFTCRTGTRSRPAQILATLDDKTERQGLETASNTLQQTLSSLYETIPLTPQVREIMSPMVIIPPTPHYYYYYSYYYYHSRYYYYSSQSTHTRHYYYYYIRIHYYYYYSRLLSSILDPDSIWYSYRPCGYSQSCSSILLFHLPNNIDTNVTTPNPPTYFGPAMHSGGPRLGAE